MYEIPQGTKCANCNEHAATVNWYGDSTAVGWVHMSPEWWCQCCTVKANIAYIEKLMANLPGLRARLARGCNVTEPGE